MSDAEAAATTLWYRRPAQEWVEALPVGNGRLGAMVFGGTAAERIQLNEETIWTGSPYDQSRQEVEPGALDEVRRLVFEGECFKAHYLFGQKLMGQPVEQQRYQTLGNLWLALPGHDAATDYRRQLDLDAGIATTSYRVGEATFTREVLASAVDQVVAVRLSADRPGALSFSARLVGGEDGEPRDDESFATVAEAPDTLVLRGRSASYLGIPGRVEYEARVKLAVEGGTATVDGDSLAVEGADAATLLVAAATNFVRYDDLSGDPHACASACLDTAAARPYDHIRADHVAEHRRLFRRVALSLPATSASQLPTDERRAAFAEGRDPQFAALLFQFGRYLLMGSSRPGCRPANLQGIWNESQKPAWEGKFTTNINLEMNYWPAEAANLPECAEPLFQLLEDVVEPGTRVARRHYGARGWVLHQNTDQWLAAAPMDGPTWGTMTTAGAWLCTHLWEHYLFAPDPAFLRRIYPLLEGAIEFFLDFLIEHPVHGWLVTCPANSPENFPACPGNHRYLDDYHQFKLPGATICAGPTMDMQILRDLFGAFVEASAALGADEPLRRKAAAARDRLAPMQVGKRGNLQEWLGDWEDLEKQHRHISHLYGLFPSDQITPDATPELAEAARVSLTERGDGTTGFSMTWKAACWARLRDGGHALVCLHNLAASQTCPNVFSKCFRAPQVDGSFGATAAVAEMLVQSHGGEIRLLPALPAAWASGAVQGLRARGGFEVDIAWADGRIAAAAIRSSLGGACRVQAAAPLAVSCEAREVPATSEDGLLVFDTKAGSQYELRPGGES